MREYTKPPLPFKEIKDGSFTDCFIEGTTWDDVYNLYLFDRKFRLLVFDAIERLEISIRTQIIYQLSHKYGSHWQDNPDIFKTVTKKDKDGNEIEINVYQELSKHIADQLHSNKAEDFLCMLNYLLQTACPNSNFSEKLYDLVEEFKEFVPMQHMGFPENWREEKKWKG